MEVKTMKARKKNNTIAYSLPCKLKYLSGGVRKRPSFIFWAGYFGLIEIMDHTKILNPAGRSGPPLM